jgi:dTDP-D-glucose 4,6-dehydratase
MINQIIKNNKSGELVNILQTIQSHNLNSVKMMDDILAKVSIEQENKELLIEMVNNYNSLLRELKTAIIKIKNNNSSKNQARLIGQILISKGYITEEQLESCLKEQSNRDLDILDELTDPLDRNRE